MDHPQDYGVLGRHHMRLDVSYQYDVFVSYKRNDQARACLTGWIHRVRDIVTHWIGIEVGRDVEVFFDSQSIEYGTNWPDTLRASLGSSRVLLCFLTPEYFRSPWCRAEWGSFTSREAHCGPLTQPLIVPVCIGGRTHFPQSAMERQMMDLSQYAQTLDSFWETQRAAELEVQLRELAKSVGLSVANAPEYDRSWPGPESDIDIREPTVALQRL